ncbi:MAG: hypothetical protein RIT81_45115 [Deltaproteobacteria bacterium]
MTTSVDAGRSPTLGRSPGLDAGADTHLADGPPNQLAQADLPPRPIEERLAGGAAMTPTAESRTLARTVVRGQEEAMRAHLLGEGGGPADVVLAQADLTAPADVPATTGPDAGATTALDGGTPEPTDVVLAQADLTAPAPVNLAPFLQRLNPDERAAMLEHPIAAFRVADTPHLAQAAAERTGLPMFSGGPGDAFRHTYWNAIMTRRVGPEIAEKFATAHETGSGNPPAHQTMDLHNNAVGRRIAIDNPDASEAALFDLVMQAHRRGELLTSLPE